MEKSKGRKKKAAIFLFWVIVWQIFAWCVGNKILLAGPWDTISAWIKEVQDDAFIRTCLYSAGRIGMGAILGCGAGIILGCFANGKRLIREVLSPFMLFLKSVPLAAVIVLLLIWWGAKGLSAAVVFIVVMPIIYTNVLQGLSAADFQMIEMAEVFRISRWNRFFYIYRPALDPFMESGLKTALGLSWKSGVAAELIGMPDYSIGEKMYLSKIYLDTAGLFAWTVTVIGLSFLFEKLGLYLWKKFCRWKPGFQRGKNRKAKSLRKKDLAEWGQTGKEAAGSPLYLADISKTYGGKRVLNHISHTLQPGQISCLMAPSGAGKTTLLRILAELETPDGKEGAGSERKVGSKDERKAGIRAEKKPGTKGKQPKAAVCFQENRLAEELSAVENVMLVTGKERQQVCEAVLKQLLPEESIHRPCHVLSGGMKRRVSLARALLAEGRLLLLDEPFAGLDEENKKKAAECLLRCQRGRIVVVATHDKDDAKLLGGEIWKL